MNDYRPVETVTAKGRTRTTYEYIGDDYYFAEDRDRFVRSRAKGLGLCAAAWLALIGAMVPISSAMETAYVALPFVFNVFPLGVLTELCISLFGAKEPMQRRYADKITKRYRPASLIAAILPGISFLGQLVNLIRGVWVLPGDVLFLICDAVVVLCAFFAWRMEARFALRAEPHSAAPAEE